MSIRDEVIAAALAEIEAELVEHVALEMGQYGCPFESPLEEKFSCWWAVFSYRWQDRYACHFDLIPQFEINLEGKSYRLDFAVDYMPFGQLGDLLATISRLRYERNGNSPDPLNLNIGVELDGHEFHERTKAQVAYRDRRDRDLQAAG